MAILITGLREVGGYTLLRYLLIMLVPALLIVIGTAGYMILEGERTNFLKALYMTVITLTTVGYGEIPDNPRPESRIFTMVLLLGGVFTFFWAAGEMIRTIVSGEVQGVLERRCMERDLAQLKDHFIVCGFGRMGKRVCREFSQQGLPFVVLERNHHLLEGFDLAHGIAVQGDAASDELLRWCRRRQSARALASSPTAIGRSRRSRRTTSSAPTSSGVTCSAGCSTGPGSASPSRSSSRRSSS